jgi:hypothetical protein
MSALNRHFARHYLEMVVVMFIGMAVLGLPAGWGLSAIGSGWSELGDEAPALMLLLMTFTMTAPMVWWMRSRGHRWQPSLEMAASMIVPTFAVIGLLAAGIAEDTGTLLLIEHVAMLAGMFAVMLARPEEYSHHHHHAVQQRATA